MYKYFYSFNYLFNFIAILVGFLNYIFIISGSFQSNIPKVLFRLSFLIYFYFIRFFIYLFKHDFNYWKQFLSHWITWWRWFSDFIFYLQSLLESLDTQALLYSNRKPRSLLIILAMRQKVSFQKCNYLLTFPHKNQCSC